MKIDVALVPAELESIRLRNSAVVVVDVLRASTTMVTALNNGAGEIIPFAEPEQAVSESSKMQRSSYLLCGERRGEKLPGFDLGNSPFEYKREIVSDKMLFFTTTNGTQLFRFAESAANVAVCSFLNMDAVAEQLLLWGNDAVVACAGNNSRFSLEDCLCAGMLINKVAGLSDRMELADSDSLSAAGYIYNNYRDDILSALKTGFHGRYLKSIGFEKDIAFASNLNTVNTVPVMMSGKLVLS
ncbi:2-phosphosulfolactate phosphatase [bacterium]|nr:2-phosphosulfolactate phosphatase [bacterium]